MIYQSVYLIPSSPICLLIHINFMFILQSYITCNVSVHHLQCSVYCHGTVAYLRVPFRSLWQLVALILAIGCILSCCLTLIVSSFYCLRSLQVWKMYDVIRTWGQISPNRITILKIDGCEASLDLEIRKEKGLKKPHIPAKSCLHICSFAFA